MSWGDVLCVSWYGEESNIFTLSSPPWPSCGGGPVFDTEYQDILDRSSTLGYASPSSAQQVKQNQLMIDIKSELGITSLSEKFDIFYVFATDGDSDFATLNWVDPSSFQCMKVNSPTFTTNQGFNGDGATSYLRTGWVGLIHAVNAAVNNFTCIYYTGNVVQDNGSPMGANDGNTNNAFYQNTNTTGSNSNFRVNDSSGTNKVFASYLSGLWALINNAINSQRIYMGGSFSHSGVRLSAANLNDAEVCICARGRDSGGTFSISNPTQTQVRIAGISSDIESSITNLDALFDAYIASL